MPKLPDGSEKGLRGHLSDERGIRERVGMAPPAGQILRDTPYKRIAVEEAWTFPALVKAQREYLASGEMDDPALKMAGMFAAMPALQEMLQDLDELRLSHMDEYGIDRQLLLLTAPGVQVVRPGEGTPLAREANDIAADACRRHPDRFSACAAFDPRDVAGSVREIERAMNYLGLAGAVLNSHFQGHYLDEPDYWPILEALEANDAALYIHPTAPFDAPQYAQRGFTGALGGFPHDVWLHAMGLIFSGAFDRFPKLRLILGHLGECMPLHLYRFDWMQSNADNVPGLRGGQPPVKLKHPVSHYFQNNIWITTSGVGWEPAIKFCMDVMGADRVLYAMDYPYQQSSDEVAAYDRLGISDADKKLLMEDNAKRVFRLK
ncbi:amidohydrolase family protein [Altericroceibacterium endophyticum]|uniref:Amidohydrolase family protein n=1 Tax=Altericroceibacterium endophyticum TaxID=1808508 RepID=A0A6I4T3E1_9SPHN|nr:amidohydrolase family protein [Altericroceibacterium endophyticum]MXO65386.1 amidohydrolase family protein [Altericroceibacterium endophyticum]